jgi:hypothetical protein
MQVSTETYDSCEAPFFNEVSLRKVVSTNSTKRNCTTTAEQLAAKWNIGLDTAKKTLLVTTQKGMRHTTHPIEQRFRTRQAQLRYNQLGGGMDGSILTPSSHLSLP